MRNVHVNNDAINIFVEMWNLGGLNDAVTTLDFFFFCISHRKVKIDNSEKLKLNKML